MYYITFFLCVVCILFTILVYKQLNEINSLKKKKKYNKLKNKSIEKPKVLYSLNSNYIILEVTHKNSKFNYRLARNKVSYNNSHNIYHILGMMPSTNKNYVLTSFRKMSKGYHPDCEGSDRAFELLVKAKDRALEKCN